MHKCAFDHTIIIIVIITRDSNVSMCFKPVVIGMLIVWGYKLFTSLGVQYGLTSE